MYGIQAEANHLSFCDIACSVCLLIFCVSSVTLVFLLSQQENNAFAVLDITAEEWLELYPMGSKSYAAGNEGGNQLDASDRDDSNQSITSSHNIVALLWP